MKKGSIFFLGTITILIIASSVFAAGVSLTGIGARGTALGGAYRGVADDWSAMFWNPAGLTQMQGLHAGISTELLWPVSTYSAAKWQDMNFSVFNEGETESEPRTFVIPASGIVFGASEKLAFGLGVWAPFGLGAKWDLLQTEKYNSQYPEFDYESDLMILDFHPTVAYKLNDMISVGAGLSVVYADIIIRTPKYMPNPYLLDPALALFKGALSQAGGLAPEFNHIIIQSKLSGTGWGFGGNLGLMVKLNDDLQIGLSGRYYTDISIDGRVDGTLFFANNAASQAIISSTLAVGQFQAKLQAGEITEEEYMVLTNCYSGGTLDVYIDEKADTKLPLPMDVGLGIAYKPINEDDNHLLLSADVMWTQWSSWDIIDIDMECGDKSQLVEKWEDSFRANAGVELKLNPMLTLRGGYYWEQHAAVDITLSPTIPDQANRHAINAGFEIKLMPLLSLHGSYERILIGDNTVDEWIYNMEESEYENHAGDYKMVVNNIMFGLGYKF